MKKRFDPDYQARWYASHVPTVLDALEDGPQTAEALAQRTGLCAESISGIVTAARKQGHKIYNVSGGKKGKSQYEMAS